MTKDKLDGSVDLLAAAMRKAFRVTVESDPEPVHEDMDAEETRPNYQISD